MPSRFEPCGLAQRICDEVWLPPDCQKNGGLATHRAFSQGESKSNGFLFSNPTYQDLWSAIQQALKYMQIKRSLPKCVKMQSPENVVGITQLKEYLQTYQWALKLP